ncbi:MAG: PucR family transcriptional regulator [Coriobacteriales bacterium]|jgi:hypothetical protein
MRVTMAMLFDGLSGRFACEKGPGFDASLPVDRAVRLSSGAVLPKHAAPFARPDDDAVTTIGNAARLVLCHEGPYELPAGASCAISLETGGRSLDQIVERASNVLSWYRSWGDRLLDDLSETHSVQRMVETAHELLGNPLIVIDRNLKVIASTKSDTMPDSLWVQKDRTYVDTLGFSEDEVDIPRLFRALSEKGYVDEFVTFDRSMSACSLNRNDADSPVACLISKSRAITEGDSQCLRFFCSLASLALTGNRRREPNEHDALSKLYSEILLGNIESQQDIDAYLFNHRLQVDRAFCVIVVSSPHRFLNGHEQTAFSSDLRTIVARSETVRKAQELVVVVNNETGQLDEAEERKLERYLASRSLVAGCSEPEDDVSALMHLYRQASAAILIGERLGDTRALHLYADCRSYAPYEACLQSDDPSSFLHPGIAKILEYDAETGSSLCETLASLFEHGGNQVAAAKDLFIQRSTMRYRIQQIERLCGIDLRDHDQYFDLEFSIRLLSYKEGNAHENSQPPS